MQMLVVEMAFLHHLCLIGPLYGEHFSEEYCVPLSILILHMLMEVSTQRVYWGTTERDWGVRQEA